MTAHYRTRAARLVFALLALAGVALFCTLGAWQWARAAWKQRLLAEQAAVLAQRDAVPLDAAFDATRSDVLDWAAGRARFDGRLVFLDNQQRGGRPGVRVYGVLQQASGPILVELGWLPWGAQRELPPAAAPQGEVDVAGVLAAPPSSGLKVGSGVQLLDGARALVTRVDLDALPAQIGVALPFAPRVLKLDPALPIGFERDLDLLPNTLPPERHRGYAVQWFALAATVAVTWIVLALRARRKGSSA